MFYPLGGQLLSLVVRVAMCSTQNTFAVVLGKCYGFMYVGKKLMVSDRVSKIQFYL